MCGLVGYVDLINTPDQAVCEKALKSITHRGPDNQSYTLENGVFLGHTRLSIIDLSDSAHQPMVDATHNVSMVYNGEVYNFRELKRDKLADETFQTTSDSEVILKGYVRYGIDFFDWMRGIFAVAIYDGRGEGKLVLARDRGGIKPLYLYETEKSIGFSSEIKALKPFMADHSINESCLKAYLNLGYCPEPHTIYRSVTALEPGAVLEFSAQGKRLHKPMKYDFSMRNEFSFEQNLERTEELVKAAVAKNLVADVDVTVALSGGVDSSLMYYYANKSQPGINGITVRFNDEAYDESPLAKRYADYLNGKQEIIDLENDFDLGVLNKILLNFDQPYADSSAIPVYYLTRASAKYSKVLIGGDGGDELFNGYPSQTWLYKLMKLKKSGLTRLPTTGLLGLGGMLTKGSKKRLLNRLNLLWSGTPVEMLYDWHSWFPRNTSLDGRSAFKFNDKKGPELYSELFAEDASLGLDEKVVFDYFRKTMLSDYLRKTDMMSMFNGVEYRVPLLDEDLVSFALSIPFEQKSALKKTKIFLRKIHENCYPPDTSKAKKKGFSIPLDKNLSRDDFMEMKNSILAKDSLVTEYIDETYINFLFKSLESRAGREADISRDSVYQRILMLYSLRLWQQHA